MEINWLDPAEALGGLIGILVAVPFVLVGFGGLTVLKIAQSPWMPSHEYLHGYAARAMGVDYSVDISNGKVHLEEADTPLRFWIIHVAPILLSVLAVGMYVCALALWDMYGLAGKVASVSIALSALGAASHGLPSLGDVLVILKNSKQDLFLTGWLAALLTLPFITFRFTELVRDEMKYINAYAWAAFLFFVSTKLLAIIPYTFRFV